MNHYERLGVGRRASSEEIRRAYRAAARTAHPDHAGGDPDAMARLNEAWYVLGDDRRRAHYDATLDPSASSTHRPPGAARDRRPTPTEPSMTGYVVATEQEERLRRLIRRVGIAAAALVTILFLIAFTQSPG